MKQSGQPEQADCGLGKLPKSLVLHMLVHKFLCNVNDTRALIGGLTPSDITVRSESSPLVYPGLHYSTYSNWSLATYPFIYSSKL